MQAKFQFHDLRGSASASSDTVLAQPEPLTLKPNRWSASNGLPRASVRRMYAGSSAQPTAHNLAIFVTSARLFSSVTLPVCATKLTLRACRSICSWKSPSTSMFRDER
jgi:hypothetical protein